MLAYRGTPPTPKECPLSVFRPSTNTDLFVTYRGKAGRRADRPPPAATDGPATGDRLATDWRPVTGRPTGDTTDTADRLAARLAAVPVTNDNTSKDQ